MNILRKHLLMLFKNVSDSKLCPIDSSAIPTFNSSYFFFIVVLSKTTPRLDGAGKWARPHSTLAQTAVAKIVIKVIPLSASDQKEAYSKKICKFICQQYLKQ